jgi:aspartyl-tRNA(Asn)/glutamyl-tRNA(Gln) amidotransferase subunit C
MAVTLQDVDYVAGLARLSFDADEKARLTAQLNQILQYMDQLNRLDTDTVEPLAHVINLDTVLRDDLLRPSLPREEILKNAPARTDEFFKVPKVIGDH